MTTKKLLIVLGVLLVLLGIAVYVLPYTGPKQPTTPIAQQNTKQFSSDELGISFLYPDNYELKTYSQNASGTKETAIVLMDIADVPVPGQTIATEGPVSITISVYDRTPEETVEDWIRNNSRSNFNLSDGVLQQAVLAGHPAIFYTWSGLYEADNVVVATDTHMYSFVVTHISPEEQIREDFYGLLETVSFTQA